MRSTTGVVLPAQAKRDISMRHTTKSGKVDTTRYSSVLFLNVEEGPHLDKSVSDSLTDGGFFWMSRIGKRNENSQETALEAHGSRAQCPRS